MRTQSAKPRPTLFCSKTQGNSSSAYDNSLSRIKLHAHHAKLETNPSLPPAPEPANALETEQTPFSDKKISQSALIVTKTSSDDSYNWQKHGQKQVKSTIDLKVIIDAQMLIFFAKKKVELCQDGRVTEVIFWSQLAKELSILQLVAMGVGSTIAALSAFCYAELASRCLSAGSAYHCSYICVGEGVAWRIGWALILEYTIGGSAVARGELIF